MNENTTAEAKRNNLGLNTVRQENVIQIIYRKYLITSMLAILGSVLGQIVNNAILGNVLGANALSVTGTTLPIHYIFSTFGALLGIGGMTVCGHLMGKNNSSKLNEAFTLIYILTVALAVIISFVMLLNLDAIVHLLSADATLFADIKIYATVMIVCGVFNMGIYPAFHLLRLDGRVWLAVAVFTVMAAVTISLDVILIFVFEMGMLGAAIAYGGGLAAASIFGAVLLFFRSNNFKLTRVKKGFYKIILEIFKLGSPSAVENLCLLLKVFILNMIIINMFGVMALSAYSLVNTILSFAFIFISGVSGSIMPFTGVMHTEKDIASIRQLNKIAFTWGTIIITVFSTICIVFATGISALFGMGSTDALQYSVPAIRTFALSLIPFMISSILICLYQSTGREKVANVFTALCNAVWIIVLAYVLSLSFGIMGLWHSLWLSQLATLICILIWAVWKRHKNPDLSKITLLSESVEKEGKYIAFSVFNNDESITQCAQRISDFCEANELSPKKSMALSLSVEELVQVIYAQNEKNPDVSVRLLILHDVTVLRIRDTGIVVDPIERYKQAESEYASGSLEALEKFQDSLGIKMVLSMTDSVIYQKTFGLNNLTILL